MKTDQAHGSDQPAANGPAPAAHMQMAALNRYIAQASQSAHQQQTNDDQPLSHSIFSPAISHRDQLAGTDGDGAWPPLRSSLRFQTTWSLIHAEAQVEQATQQAPANAGPLNPHRLVLRTLAMMREISPDYLQQFLSQLDTLQWLEQAMPIDKPAATSKPKANTRKR